MVLVMESCKNYNKSAKFDFLDKSYHSNASLSAGQTASFFAAFISIPIAIPLLPGNRDCSSAASLPAHGITRNGTSVGVSLQGPSVWSTSVASELTKIDCELTLVASPPRCLAKRNGRDNHDNCQRFHDEVCRFGFLVQLGIERPLYSVYWTLHMHWVRCLGGGGSKLMNSSISVKVHWQAI